MRLSETAAIAAATLLTIILLGARPVMAHVEGHMPDSVAEMEYRILLEFKPDDFISRTKLATALLNQNKLQEAGEEFERVLALAPDHLPGRVGLSLLRLRQNRVAEALVLIEKAVAQAPDNALVYLDYGKILEAAQRPREALQMYRLGLNKLEAGSGNPADLHDRPLFLDSIAKIEPKP